MHKQLSEQVNRCVVKGYHLRTRIIAKVNPRSVVKEHNSYRVCGNIYMVCLSCDLKMVKWYLSTVGYGSMYHNKLVYVRGALHLKNIQVARYLHKVFGFCNSDKCKCTKHTLNIS